MVATAGLTRQPAEAWEAWEEAAAWAEFEAVEPCERAAAWAAVCVGCGVWAAWVGAAAWAAVWVWCGVWAVWMRWGA